MTELEERSQKRSWLRWLFTVRGLVWSFLGLIAFALVLEACDSAHMVELRKNDPQAYLAELRDRNRIEWMIELKRLDPEGFEEELKRRQPAIDKIVAELKTIPASKTDQNIELYKRLTKLVAQSVKWFDELKSGKAKSITDIAKRDQIDRNEISRLLPLAFLAPDLIEKILKGDHPVSLTANRLKRMSNLPMDWQEQRNLFASL